MNLPVRIQRKRTKGFKLPPNTVCVTRGTKYGNPFRVGFSIPDEYLFEVNRVDYERFFERKEILTNKTACELFEKYALPELDIEPLVGKNLACFCKLEDYCHADVLLKIANE